MKKIIGYLLLFILFVWFILIIYTITSPSRTYGMGWNRLEFFLLVLPHEFLYSPYILFLIMGFIGKKLSKISIAQFGWLLVFLGLIAGFIIVINFIYSPPFEGLNSSPYVASSIRCFYYTGILSAVLNLIGIYLIGRAWGKKCI
ncbi:MAG: hypothetical protein HQK76_21160 [Desulfobacterales bacterium]|nr:hypothetical protein [Desulfobacterales bacterium]